MLYRKKKEFQVIQRIIRNRNERTARSDRARTIAEQAMASWSIGERGSGGGGVVVVVVVIPVDAMTISGAVGPARCGPMLEVAGFQEREPLDLLAGVINCTSFN